MRFSAPLEAIQRGLGFCPEDRKAEGIIPELSVRENIALALQADDARDLFEMARRIHAAAAAAFTRLQAHDHELGVLAGEQNLAKVGVLQGLAFDRSNEACHWYSPLVSRFGANLDVHGPQPRHVLSF